MRGAATATRRRLDLELVRRGLVESREQARAAVEAQRVIVSGALATKPARLVDPGEPVELLGDGPRFVSRGGDKLDAALDRFGIDVDGRRILDAGASTGGFTDCVLQRGATAVVAVDVGHGQLHERLRGDPRVEVRERTDVRSLPLLDPPPHLVVADLSFISLRAVLPALVAQLPDGGALVLLVKPQFEAGRQEADRGRGVIRDPAIWRRVLGEVNDAISDAAATMMGVMASPVRGGSGNVEFLVHVEVAPSDEPLLDAGAAIEAALASVEG